MIISTMQIQIMIYIYIVNSNLSNLFTILITIQITIIQISFYTILNSNSYNNLTVSGTLFNFINAINFYATINLILIYSLSGNMHSYIICNNNNITYLAL